MGVSSDDTYIPANNRSKVLEGKSVVRSSPIERFLVQKNYSQTKILADRFGGYPAEWLSSLEATLREG